MIFNIKSNLYNLHNKENNAIKIAQNRFKVTRLEKKQVVLTK